MSQKMTVLKMRGLRSSGEDKFAPPLHRNQLTCVVSDLDGFDISESDTSEADEADVGDGKHEVDIGDGEDEGEVLR